MNLLRILTVYFQIEAPLHAEIVVMKPNYIWHCSELFLCQNL